MQDVYYLDIESSKKDLNNKKDRVTTTDLVVKKEGKFLRILDCRMENGFTYGIGEIIRASRFSVYKFILRAIESFNQNPNKPTNLTLRKFVRNINYWGEEADESILPDRALINLGIDPSSINRDMI